MEVLAKRQKTKPLIVEYTSVSQGSKKQIELIYISTYPLAHMTYAVITSYAVSAKRPTSMSKLSWHFMAVNNTRSLRGIYTFYIPEDTFNYKNVQNVWFLIIFAAMYQSTKIQYAHDY